ncbi:MAG: M23 family metallopeptidase [Polyangiales bacterium]
MVRSFVPLMVASGALVLVGFSPRVLEVREQTNGSSNGSAPVASANGSGELVVAGSCPAGTFPDDGACVGLPDENFGEDPVGAPEGEVIAQGHFEKSGRWLVYDQIPRRPDRPADYEAYVYPIPGGLPRGKHVVSGYDLDLPDTLQRRGKMRAVGHGAVDLPQKRGTPIGMIALEHQVGDAEVLHVGSLMGYSVVTRHTLREGGNLREYVLIFGHLDKAAPGLVRGATLKVGDLVGFVGDTGSPELVHLHLEARRLREGIEGAKLLPGRILAPDVSIVCDPRNVLPIKGA